MVVVVEGSRCRQGWKQSFGGRAGGGGGAGAEVVQRYQYILFVDFLFCGIETSGS